MAHSAFAAQKQNLLAPIFQSIGHDARTHMTIYRPGDSSAALFKGGEQCTKVMLEHFFVANRRTSTFGERIGK